MKKLILASLMLFSSSVFAQSGPVEALIDRSHFDGRTFNYEYTAYETDKVEWDVVVDNCIHGDSAEGKVLKAVEVKVFCEANTKPSKSVKRKGTVDIQRLIKGCLAGRTQKWNQIEVRLPRITIPLDPSQTNQ